MSVVPDDEAERLSADDMAARRSAELVEDALARQARAAGQAQQVARGRCANCGEPCLPQLRWCDDECRADHEHRQRVLARQGRA